MIRTDVKQVEENSSKLGCWALVPEDEVAAGVGG